MSAHHFTGFVFLLAAACAPLSATSTPIQTFAQPPSPLPPVMASDAPTLIANDGWMQKASMPTARSEMPAFELNGLVYVPGGFGPLPNGLANGYGPVNTFDVYDPATDQWKPLAPMPEGRHHIMMAVYRGKIYAFGGFLDPWITQSNTWVYDPASDHWQVLKPMPAPRTAGAAVTLGDFIYLVGGTTSHAGSALPTWRYDPVSDAWKDVASLQQPREHNAAVVLDGKIYALGGRWVTTYSTVEVYDPAVNRWTWGTPMQHERAGFGASVMDGKIYVGGGELIETLKTLNSAEVFDPATNTWSSLPDMPARLHGVPLVGVRGLLFMVGGSARSADVINWGRVFALRP
jgi:N-acetylneuraminic acid mutarotase